MRHLADGTATGDPPPPRQPYRAVAGAVGAAVEGGAGGGNAPVMSVDRMWERVEALLGKHPQALSLLASGADEGAIHETERKLGLTLPEPFKQSVARHDGQLFELPWLVGGGRLLPLDDILEEWKTWNDLARTSELEDEDDEPVRADRGVAAVWWSRGWVPIVDRDGDQLCIDLAPTAGGRAGQVITLWHEVGVRERVAHDFQEWLGLWAADLEERGIEGNTRCWPIRL